MTGEDIRRGVHEVASLAALLITAHNTVRYLDTGRGWNLFNAVCSGCYFLIERANMREHPVVPPSPYDPTHMGVGA